MQGESLWLHLDIIKSLAAMCHEVFVGGTVQYAYTTIPTYPRWGPDCSTHSLLTTALRLLSVNRLLAQCPLLSCPTIHTGLAFHTLAYKDLA